MGREASQNQIPRRAPGKHSRSIFCIGFARKFPGTPSFTWGKGRRTASNQPRLVLRRSISSPRDAKIDLIWGKRGLFSTIELLRYAIRRSFPHLLTHTPGKKRPTTMAHGASATRGSWAISMSIRFWCWKPVGERDPAPLVNGRLLLHCHRMVSKAWIEKGTELPLPFLMALGTAPYSYPISSSLRRIDSCSRIMWIFRSRTSRAKRELRCCRRAFSCSSR